MREKREIDNKLHPNSTGFAEKMKDDHDTYKVN